MENRLFLHGLTELVRLQNMCSYPCKIIVVTAYDEIEQLCKELSAIDCIVVRNQGTQNDGIASSNSKRHREQTALSPVTCPMQG